jgi:hypothetical protein
VVSWFVTVSFDVPPAATVRDEVPELEA